MYCHSWRGECLSKQFLILVWPHTKAVVSVWVCDSCLIPRPCGEVVWEWGCYLCLIPRPCGRWSGNEVANVHLCCGECLRLHLHIALLHLFMKQVQRNCLQNWEKTVLQKQEMSLEGLSQWERDFHLSLFTPPLPHPSLFSTHIPPSNPSPKVRHIATDEIMVLKINKRMNGVRKRNEVELLKRLSHPNILQWVATRPCTHSHAHTHTHTHTHTFTHHTLACTNTVCKQWFGASFTW